MFYAGDAGVGPREAMDNLLRTMSFRFWAMAGSEHLRGPSHSRATHAGRGHHRSHYRLDARSGVRLGRLCPGRGPPLGYDSENLPDPSSY